jgi:hypothetical protein
VISAARVGEHSAVENITKTERHKPQDLIGAETGFKAVVAAAHY